MAYSGLYSTKVACEGLYLFHSIYSTKHNETSLALPTYVLLLNFNFPSVLLCANEIKYKSLVGPGYNETVL